MSQWLVEPGLDRATGLGQTHKLELPLAAWHEAASRVVGRLARALNFELNDLATHAIPEPHDAGMQALTLSARAWVEELRERTVFRSVHAIKMRFARRFEPQVRWQINAILKLLEQAGMPAD